jgi:hypothetical protein
MKYNTQQKTAAFEAYSKGVLTDDELKCAYESVTDLIDTMRAMGEKGNHMLGYIMFQSSLGGMIDGRARDRKDESRKSAIEEKK